MATPLEHLSDHTIFLQLGHVLWSWELCKNCLQGVACISNACPGQRISYLQRYYQFYKTSVSAYIGDWPGSSRSLQTHDDLFQTIRAIKSNPDINLLELYQCNHPEGDFMLIPEEYCNAVTLVVKVLVMVESSPLHHSSDRLEKGTRRVYWKDHTPFSKYMQELFPIENHPILSSKHADVELLTDMKSELRATKLIKHIGITFTASHDISNHLRFDRKTNVVQIFHHVAFLKEQLRATKGEGDFSKPSASIKVGSLPRQLGLEVLDSIQGILFPLSDRKSRHLLKSLVHSCSFDPEIMNFEFSSIRTPERRLYHTYISPTSFLISTSKYRIRAQGHGWRGRWNARAVRGT